ncbi:cytochrome b [[Pseudomonas] carboxydohydrogena]|jgi:cytochrome b561|uniref:Cytochrome b n=1 Tax=Afipia carboxydohydrogena TaxID=290 RepID=A0ABY8BPT6_AFICR|nr:cytochrome b [[Pseudomonas] carboxydohydrogena]WEF52013.1 cytochrome b [[Pseudomonas] carboxydohydrogena]BEV46100.1 cytochrome b [Afipia carboxidovorans]
MSPALQYGTTAKILHWTTVGLLVIQYPLGWLMPDIHGGMQPGVGMTFHISIGLVILAVFAVRLSWRLTHPVVPESSLPAWQRLTSELTHWMLYVMVLLTTITGWLFASFRGWSASFFYLFPFPMLASGNAQVIKSIDGLHQAAEWILLGLISLHVAAALIHFFYYRDRIMARMLTVSRR